MYKLNPSSRSARFYSWIWNTEVTRFKTMCPYFWNYVLTILFLPVILTVKLIFWMMPAKDKICQGIDYVAESQVGQVTGKVFSPSKFWDVVGKIFKWLFFILLGLLALALVIALIVAFYEQPIGGLSIIGGLVVAFLVLGGVLYAFDEYSLGSKIAMPFKFVGNMIYSLYKNFCPLINWN